MTSKTSTKTSATARTATDKISQTPAQLNAAAAAARIAQATAIQQSATRTPAKTAAKRTPAKTAKTAAKTAAKRTPATPTKTAPKRSASRSGPTDRDTKREVAQTLHDMGAKWFAGLHKRTARGVTEVQLPSGAWVSRTTVQYATKQVFGYVPQTVKWNAKLLGPRDVGRPAA